MTDQPEKVQQHKNEAQELPRKRKWLRQLVRAVLTLAFLLVCVLALGYWLATKTPDFYRWSEGQDIKTLKNLSDRFEITALDLQNQARTRDDWQVVFNESEINAWLVSELEKKFPDAMPVDFDRPQIKIEEAQLWIGGTKTINSTELVFNAAVDVFFTETQGELAIQVQEVHAGKLPIPISIFAESLSTSLSHSALPVSWTESGDGPVVLVQLPRDMIQLGDRSVRLTSIQLLVGKLILTGQSVKNDGP